uniref:Uncharacterized protein n=2 Tax=Lygus hesperus TaxID=30085 RepID=A0A146LZ37_LYGHE
MPLLPVADAALKGERVWMLRYLLVFSSLLLVRGDDPKDISRALSVHVAANANHLPKLAFVGDLVFGNVIMRDAFLGDLTTMKLVNKAWFWRKFVWFSVFGDVKLDEMYLTAQNFTIGGNTHAGMISIEDNTLHFNFEAIDHFKCTIINERVDWLPLKGLNLHEGRTKTSLNFSDGEIEKLKNKLLSYDFFTQFRNILLPCLHPKYPITYRWEDTEY